MPFKLDQDRRHHVPRQKHRVTNSAAYDAALRQRGSLAIWFTDEAIAGWRAERRTTPGGQPWYSPPAILTARTLRAVFRLALRQAEGLIGSIIGLLGLEPRVPGHLTLSRRAKTLEVARAQPHRNGESLHPLVDSTGLRLCGAGEWLQEKHGTKTRRSWRKLHIGLDAGSGRIIATPLTAQEIDDGAEVGPLLNRITGAVAAFVGDGGYDQDNMSAAVAERHPDAAETAPTQRDRHLQHVEPAQTALRFRWGSPDVAEHGRMAWQRASGYVKRAGRGNDRPLQTGDRGRAAFAHG